MSTRGRLTARIVKTISPVWAERGYKVLYGHGPQGENLGEIVSVIEEPYGYGDELSRLDIAIVKQSLDRLEAVALIEIEEMADKPKVLLGDIFGALLGEHICFRGEEICIGDFTALIVIGINRFTHHDRRVYIFDQVMRVKAYLSARNAKIGKIVTETYSGGEQLIEDLPSRIDAELGF